MLEQKSRGNNNNIISEIPQVDFRKDKVYTEFYSTLKKIKKIVFETVKISLGGRVTQL